MRAGPSVLPQHQLVALRARRNAGPLDSQLQSLAARIPVTLFFEKAENSRRSKGHERRAEWFVRPARPARPLAGFALPFAQQKHCAERGVLCYNMRVVRGSR